jgi:hypothetical protein
MQTTTSMTAKLGEVHRTIGRELLLLYTKWNYYKRLFCADDETVRLLNGAAAFFFRICDDVLRDDIILTVCRLTDPASTTVRNQKRENLAIGQLMDLIPSSDGALLQAIETEVTALTSLIRTLREHRNRRIGHYDLDTRIRRASNRLPGIGLDDMDAILAKLAHILNGLEAHYGQNTAPYSAGIYGEGSAEDLIDFVQRKEQLERDSNRMEFGDEDDETE